MILVSILLYLARFHSFSLMQNFPSCKYTGLYLYFLLLADNWIIFILRTNTNDATINILYIPISIPSCIPVGYTSRWAILLNHKGMHTTISVVDFVKVFQRAHNKLHSSYQLCMLSSFSTTLKTLGIVRSFIFNPVGVLCHYGFNLHFHNS